MNTQTLKRARDAYFFAEHCCEEFKAGYQAEADAAIIVSLALAHTRNPQAFARWLASRNL